MLPLALSACVLTVACFEEERGEPYYGRVEPPRAQEFRWSDGGLPRVFDPALAAAPPDTDAVRALFDGLTDYDPVSLEPTPAVAERWEASADSREWTFHLRRGARWSNGDPVTARDFVRSWQRTLRLGYRAPHARLLGNIEGAESALALVVEPDTRVLEPPFESPAEEAAGGSPATRQSPLNETRNGEPTGRGGETVPPAAMHTPEQTFGAIARDEHTLVVSLKRRDENFPALVAHPVFRPVHESDAEASGEGAARDDAEGAVAVVTNGAFRLARASADAVELERASDYWDAGSVALERLRFVAARDPEAALAAYREGKIDAVSNTAFAPLALKLLAPYQDFRRGTYAALTYYGFNLARAPFDDRRVREALAISVSRERLSGDTLGGATQPAWRFLPDFAGANKSAARPSQGSGDGNVDKGARPESQAGEDRDETATPLIEDTARARQLLAEAGYPGGANFPRIRLLVNRNEQQRAVAQSVAAMWRDRLGVATEIVTLGWDEYEAALWTGAFDVARLGVVLQTTDDQASMNAVLARLSPPRAGETREAGATAGTAEETPARESEGSGEQSKPTRPPELPPYSEAEALRELPAFPLYFASSHALVKPYVRGFDANLLDAPSLKRVRIDTDWRTPDPTSQIQLTRAGE